MTRKYVDRFGRTITNPESIEARRMLEQLHRCTTVGAKAGREWPYTTVGDVAKATKKTAGDVVAWVCKYDVWLLGLVKNDGPVEGWGIYQDGE